MPHIQVERLKALPQDSQAVWQGGFAPLPALEMITGDAVEESWGLLWACEQIGSISKPRFCLADERTPEAALDAAVEFAESSDSGGRRPGRIEVNDAAVADFLRSRLGEAGIEVVHRDAIPILDDFADHTGQVIIDTMLKSSILEDPDIDREDLRRFAEAAAAFYRAAPWRHLTAQDVLRIDRPSPPRGFEWATVDGAAETAPGVDFYPDRQVATRMYHAHDMQDIIDAAGGGLWHLTYDPREDAAPIDVAIWDREDLPLPDERVYPSLFWMGDEEIYRPGREQLRFVTGFAAALARTTEDQIDTGQWSVEVELDEGPVTYAFALPDLLDPPDRGELIERGHMPDRRGLEQIQTVIRRYLENQQVDDIDQANQLIRREFTGKPADTDKAPPRDDREKAQDLCYQAFDAIGRQQLQLVRQALALDPDCADAYVLLAERALGLEEAVRLYEQGTVAAERALGPESFEHNVGHFWGILETRPYMRARYGLAWALEGVGRREEAVDHYRELLRLNPTDHQGVREDYLACLMLLDRDREAAGLIKQYPDDGSSVWAYGRALLAFRRGGDNNAARTDLQRARQCNPHVADWLNEPPPTPFDVEVDAPGAVEEAVRCLSYLRPVIDATPGAADWLKNAGEVRQRVERRRKPKRRKRRRR